MVFTIKDHLIQSETTPVAFLKSPNVGGKITPRFLVIHYTASGPNSNTAAYFANPAHKVSAHIVIRRDGTVIQCVPFNVTAWHAGESRWRGADGKMYVGLNKHSIGIEIENWGPLQQASNGWLSWTSAPVDQSKGIEARHRFGTPNGGWEVYTEAEIEAAIEVARAICSTYKIDEIVGHDDISPGRKSDPGPAWNMGSFRAKVLGRDGTGDGSFVVSSPTGLNVRSGPGSEHPLVRPKPLPDGTHVMVHEANGKWRFVSVPNAAGEADFTGWVHGDWLRAA
jgi:N-acetylmuramoyl-L-alanine amidase